MKDLGAYSIDIQLLVTLKMVIAATLGAIIGWERDRAGKSAGTRTMALVGTSSALVVAIGEVLNEGSEFGDPTRALHAVVTGIGFLGAGLIFTIERSREIQGVTTAATVFSTACMGIAVGLGFYITAGAFALTIIIILRSTHILEKAHNARTSSKSSSAS
jgi:putative Mg2+ transporter-C (MgtC) family protein